MTQDHDAPAAPAAVALVEPPLAAFKGAEPPAADWFKAALARQPERLWVQARGSKLELLSWGHVGKPGLVFLHGARAQADWWSFIAPFFAEHYRVAAFSLPGMGRSEWRDRYDIKHFPDDAEAVALAAGLHESDRPPVYVGHSFGGANVFHMAGQRPERMAGLILVDSVLRGPSPAAAAEQQRKAGVGPRPAEVGAGARRLYRSQADALTRFRLMPPQPAGNLFVADYIARQMLEPVVGLDGQVEGWSWRYDPDYWPKFDYDTPRPLAYGRQITIPVAHIHGELSAFHLEPDQPDVLPPHAIEFEIPGAHHHVMIDQPLALVTAIRAVLAAWGR